MSDAYLIWWLHEEGVRAVYDLIVSCGYFDMDCGIPGEVQSEVKSMYGRLLRGRLWTAADDAPSGVKWDAKRAAQYTPPLDVCGGIVFKASALTETMRKIGVITTLDLVEATNAD